MKPERLTFLKQLAQDARELDSTRLITSGDGPWTTRVPLERTFADPLRRGAGCTRPQRILGMVLGPAGRCRQDAVEVEVDKPLIVSEFGGGAPYGRYGDADERTEEYQENLFQHQLGMVERMPNLAGLTPWVLMDFRSPARMLPVVQDYHNRKGLISNRGQSAEAGFLYAAEVL